MDKVKSFLGYTWASLTLVIILATFMGMTNLESAIGTLGLKISPWITGGEIKTELEHETYNTLIYEPVFKGLLQERKEGFVQVAWMPSIAPLPQQITEEIDFDADGTKDFRLTVDTVQDTATLEPYNARVLKLLRIEDVAEVVKLKNGRVIRVGLKNQR